MASRLNLLLAFVLLVSWARCNGFSMSKDWWETASFYQIYPRSFKDSDGDGIGDINGITEKLEYLKDIGITATWLSPVFTSPMADFGYDISNYYDINPDYGTIDDLKRLVEKANSLDIKILLDFVPNHTSDEHEWFKKSERREPGYEDYYVWHSGYSDTNNGSHRWEPNNWKSVFRKSAWHWSETRGEFYYHQFHYKQPDLNYRSPRVADEMKSVMRFWLDRGIAGFRIDAVSHLFEVAANKEGQLPSEPRSSEDVDPDDYHYLAHIYTMDQPETVDMVYQFRELLDDYQREHGGATRIIMTESYSSLDVVMQYYGNGERNGCHIPFNFQMFGRITGLSPASDYIGAIREWMSNMPPGRTANWVVGNHDNPRIAARTSIERVDAINMIILTLPGVSVTYNGEEIGMNDQWISWEDTVDPWACNSGPERYQYYSRDPARTPFQWSDQKNSGFSTANKTWLPVATSYRDVNVERQLLDNKSHLNMFKQLQRLRWERTLMYGQVQYSALGYQTIVICRHLNGQIGFFTVANVGPYAEKINIKAWLTLTPDVLLFYIMSGNSYHRIDDAVSSSSVDVRPYESFVLRTQYPF